MGWLFLTALIFWLALRLFIGSGLLLGIKKLLKVANPSYGKALAIITVAGIAKVIVDLVLDAIKLGPSASLAVSFFLVFVVFHWILKKFYRVDWQKSLQAYIAFAVVATVLDLSVIIPTRRFMVEPYYVRGDGMIPTYQDRDYLLINKFDRRFTRGDVIIHRHPSDRKQFFIRRIIGLPGERVEIAGDGGLTVNGQQRLESNVLGQRSATTTLMLQEGEFFVLADNQDSAMDSRLYGPVAAKDILGKVLYRFPGRR